MEVRVGRRLLTVALLAVAMPFRGAAQSLPPPNLGQMSLEDLMKIEITSASRKEQRTADVAAAVFVVTREDIRRSGATTIPDLLRAVPGVNVAQINSNKWAVSVRGFNGLYSNKLLVLVDGRTVYSRLYSGVPWDEQDLMLDDIERIEVTRGPGAAMWGANAMNGVINIVTKTAADTQGGLARADGGNQSAQAAARFGGKRGAMRYRLFAQWTGREPSLTSPGIRANDRSHSETTGFRVEWTDRPGTLILDGALTAGQSRALWPNLDPATAFRNPIADAPSDGRTGHLLGRWTRPRDGGALFQLQAFVDIAHRQEPVGDYRRHVFDIDTQYHARLGEHQDLIVGAGYRFIEEGLGAGVGISLSPETSRLSLLTGFVQDEATFFRDRLAVTLASQAQYDSDAGAGLQPTARLMWKALPRQRFWASAAHALRTPSLQDRGIRAVLPVAPSPGGLPVEGVIVGNSAARTEKYSDVEGGYRLEIGTVGSIDITGFIGRYDRLQTQEPGTPVVELGPSPRVLVTTTFGNELQATTKGLEASARWMPTPAWRFEGSYTTFHLTPHLSATSSDPAAPLGDGNAPAAAWQLSAAFSAGTRATLYGAIGHVGRLKQLQIDAYTRADFTAEIHLGHRLSLMAIGQNLFDAAHAEFGGAGSVLLATQMPRSLSLRLRWNLQ